MWNTTELCQAFSQLALTTKKIRQLRSLDATLPHRRVWGKEMTWEDVTSRGYPEGQKICLINLSLPGTYWATMEITWLVCGSEFPGRSQYTYLIVCRVAVKWIWKWHGDKVIPDIPGEPSCYCFTLTCCPVLMHLECDWITEHCTRQWIQSLMSSVAEGTGWWRRVAGDVTWDHILLLLALSSLLSLFPSFKALNSFSLHACLPKHKPKVICAPLMLSILLPTMIKWLRQLYICHILHGFFCVVFLTEYYSPSPQVQNLLLKTFSKVSRL